MIAPLTQKVLAAKNLNTEEQFPKGLDVVFAGAIRYRGEYERSEIDARRARKVEWPVPDPIGEAEEVYRLVESQIEGLVMRLILELRAAT